MENLPGFPDKLTAYDLMFEIIDELVKRYDYFVVKQSETTSTVLNSARDIMIMFNVDINGNVAIFPSTNHLHVVDLETFDIEKLHELILSWGTN